MGLDYEKMKNEFIAELLAGDYDTDILPNEEVDYQSIQNGDFEAFKEYLKSDNAKILSSKILEK
jgi:hypothetical protein